MKLYNISLTITDEDNNEQLVALRAPHLNGKQMVDLTSMVTAGVILEPEPEIVTVPLPPKKKKHRLGFRKRANNIDLKELENL